MDDDVRAKFDRRCKYGLRNVLSTTMVMPAFGGELLRAASQIRATWIVEFPRKAFLYGAERAEHASCDDVSTR